MKALAVVLAVVLASILLSTAPVAAGELKDDLVALEKSLWKAWGKADGEKFQKHLLEDAVQVVAGTGLVSGRKAIVAEVSTGACKLESFEFHDIALHRLAPDVVMLSYKATQDATCGDIKLPPKIYSTSIYVRKGKEWRSASYQETPLE